MIIYRHLRLECVYIFKLEKSRGVKNNSGVKSATWVDHLYI